MRPELQELCNRFIQNRDVIKDNFFWQNANFYPIAAYSAAAFANANS